MPFNFDANSILTLFLTLLYLLFILYVFWQAEPTYLYDEDMHDCTELNKEDETTHA